MAENQIADVLERVADLIEPEGAWTQGAFARDQDGRATTIDDASACSFCLRGALYRVAASLYESDRVEDFLSTVLPKNMRQSGSRITRFNDAPERTQAEVVSKLREAAAKARGTP